MPASTRAVALDTFTTFGDLLRYLRRRAGLTQIELSIAVGYSHAQISRLEQNQRPPDRATLAARFVPALHLEDELDTVARLLELAGPADASFQQAETHSVPRHNLPTQLTSFIGREQEIAEVTRLLGGRDGPAGRLPAGEDVPPERLYHRLVTLIGAGGCGKTRLALQVAPGLVAEYPDGVWLVELAPLSDPALVLPTVAATQGLREIPGQPLDKALAEVVRLKTLLLILDNCEHVIQACAELAETLLRACPNLKLLATSREALNIAGETALSVPSLSLPDVHQSVDVSTVTQSEAVRLFADRAIAAKSDFKLTDANAPTVAQICLRLDGIPLALELAAARVRALSLEQIAARLDDRFRLLTGGSRTALPRHQTLAALMDWSYDLLSETERAVLRRLAVFWGGWTVEAAEAVCMGEGIETAEVLNLLTHLVDKSLVFVEGQGRETRYGLLETIREYALRRLIESGELESVRRRQASFFLALAEAVKPRDATRGAWLEQFVTEHDNLRAALDWAFESAPDLGLQLVEALVPLWFNGGYTSEGRGHLRRALEMTEAIGSPDTRAQMLHDAGRLAWQQGDYAAARSLFEESETLSRQIGYKPLLAGSLVLLGRMMEVVQGPHAPARSLQEEGVAISRDLGDKWSLALLLSYLGGSVAARGDDVTARSLQGESAALFRELGSKEDLATPLGYLGYLALRQGDYTAACSLFEESLARWKASHRWGTAWRLEGFAGLAVKEEEWERAARLYGAAQALLDSIGAQLDPIDRLGYDQYVAAAREQLGEAAFAKAWAEGRAMTVEQAIAYALENWESYEYH